MKGPLISVGAILAVLSGCPETPTESAVEVVQAREDAVQDVNEARWDANEAVADTASNALVKAVRVDFGVASTEANGSYDVAKAKCDAFHGDDKTACFSIANATAIRDAERVSSPNTMTTRTPAFMRPGL